MQENWAQLPEGRKFGAAIKVQIDHSDGKSIWVFDRCGATECTNSTLAPTEKFDSSGKFQKAIGADMFAVPHGFYVHDPDTDGALMIAHGDVARTNAETGQATAPTIAESSSVPESSEYHLWAGPSFADTQAHRTIRH